MNSANQSDIWLALIAIFRTKCTKYHHYTYTHTADVTLVERARNVSKEMYSIGSGIYINTLTSILLVNFVMCSKKCFILFRFDRKRKCYFWFWKNIKKYRDNEEKKLAFRIGLSHNFDEVSNLFLPSHTPRPCQ